MANLSFRSSYVLLPQVMALRVTHRELQISLIQLLISTIHLVIQRIVGITK